MSMNRLRRWLYQPFASLYSSGHLRGLHEKHSAWPVQTQKCQKDMQLQKEMQLALHPEHGQAEAAALAKEVSRLKLCLSEVQSQQHRLQTDISHAIAKRETSVVKVSFLADILGTIARLGGSLE